MWSTSLLLRLAGSLGLFLYLVERPVEGSTRLTPSCHVPTQSKPVVSSAHTDRRLASANIVGSFGLGLKVKNLVLVRSKRLRPPEVAAHTLPDLSSTSDLACVLDGLLGSSAL